MSLPESCRGRDRTKHLPQSDRNEESSECSDRPAHSSSLSLQHRANQQPRENAIEIPTSESSCNSPKDPIRDSFPVIAAGIDRQSSTSSTASPIATPNVCSRRFAQQC